MEGTAQALEWLHLGNQGLPILPVAAGLANSREHLQTCGLYRVSSVWTPECPSAAEARESVKAFFEHFDRDGAAPAAGGDTEAWAGRIASSTCGWPMHIHNALKSLAEECAHAPEAGAELDPRAAEDGAERRRRTYYARRIGGLPAEILAPVLDAIPPRPQRKRAKHSEASRIDQFRVAGIRRRASR